MNSKLILGLALASLPNAVSNTTEIKLPPIPRGEEGTRLGAGTKDDQVFTDSRGRKYTRDKHGTIRRHVDL